ncbi:MAG: GAF domain-containing protein [Rhodothalassiaceae bacterium]
MTPEEKRETYERVRREIAAVLEGERHPITMMSTINCLLAEAFPYYYWTGFYLVDPERPDELIVGPYQGTLGCLRIPFGKGVCGAAAATGEIQIVPDVHAFPGHIACDSRSNSEIVLPVRDRDGRLIAVFDVDSTDFGSFDAIDAEGLLRILEDSFSR